MFYTKKATYTRPTISAAYAIIKTAIKDRLSIKKNRPKQQKRTKTPVSEIEEMNCSDLSKCSSFKKFPSQNNRTILTIAAGLPDLFFQFSLHLFFMVIITDK
jgi:hypothetical protein